MGSGKKRGERSPRRQSGSGGTQPRSVGKADRFSLTQVVADGETQQKQRLYSMAAFLGYMLAVWLIVQSANNQPSEPVIGFRWSPALLGLVVALATALIRNERNIRSFVRVFDADRSSRLVYSIAWSVLSLVAMGAIMTMPRY